MIAASIPVPGAAHKHTVSLKKRGPESSTPHAAGRRATGTTKAIKLRTSMNKACLVFLPMLLFTCVCLSAETNTAKLTGIQLKACATALEHFTANKEGANLEHYTVEVTQGQSEFEVSFVPDHPEGEATVRGGATKYGREAHYIVSKEHYQIKRRLYGR